jgi:excinuclease ABC subunit C
MTSLAKSLKFEVLESELEALLIEAELIRAHQPFYNSLLKDDKSNIYLLITDEKFPRVLRVRKTDLKKQKFQKNMAILGPFPSSYKLNEVLKIVRPIFPWCNKSSKNNKACLYYHLDLCPGACCQEISSLEYKKNIKNLIEFLKGRSKVISKELKKEMLAAAEKEKFEEAQKIKKQLENIDEITSKQYKLKPNLILPNFHQKNRDEALVHLRRIMSNEGVIDNNYQFHRIEGYDVSNIQGTNAVVSMVCFIDGYSQKDEYKYFKIRSLDTPNDYKMLQEALERRIKHPEWGKVDLIVIDGGKGQVRAVKKIIKNYCPVIGLVKHPDRLVLSIENKDKRDQIETKVISLIKNHPTLKMLEEVRDESHRFAKKQHTRLRNKNLLK